MITITLLRQLRDEALEAEEKELANVGVSTDRYYMLLGQIKLLEDLLQLASVV